MLDMPSAVVPDHPGAFSAIGLALAGESTECILPVLRDLKSLGPRELRALGREASDTVNGQLTGLPTTVRCTAALRYQGQGQSLPVPLAARSMSLDSLAQALATAHQSLFGFVPKDREIELVEVHARAETPMARLPVRRRSRTRGAAANFDRTAPVGKSVWPVFRREELVVDQTLRGPCVIEEATGATIVPRGDTCKVLPIGLLLPSGR